MIELSEEQRKSIDEGNAVRVQENGREYVLLRPDVYDRLGRSLKQMSREFETPIGTIKRRLHVARIRLKKALERGTKSRRREVACV